MMPSVVNMNSSSDRRRVVADQSGGACEVTGIDCQGGASETAYRETAEPRTGEVAAKAVAES